MGFSVCASWDAAMGMKGKRFAQFTVGHVYRLTHETRGECVARVVDAPPPQEVPDGPAMMKFHWLTLEIVDGHLQRKSDRQVVGPGQRARLLVECITAAMEVAGT